MSNPFELDLTQAAGLVGDLARSGAAIKAAEQAHHQCNRGRAMAQEKEGLVDRIISLNRTIQYEVQRHNSCPHERLIVIGMLALRSEFALKSLVEKLGALEAEQ